jgi:hypothetical protein
MWDLVVGVDGVVFVMEEGFCGWCSVGGRVAQWRVWMKSVLLCCLEDEMKRDD